VIKPSRIYGIGQAVLLRAPADGMFKSFDYDQICLRCDEKIVEHCRRTDVKQPGHEQGKPFVLSKQKDNSFSVKFVCLGSHGHEFKFIPDEKYVLTITAIKQDGTQYKLNSPSLSLTGSRDKRREPPARRHISRAGPYEAAAVIPTSAHEPTRMLHQQLPVDVMDHQQNNHNPPQTHALTLVSDLNDSFLESYDLDSPDFHRGRFVN